MKKLKIIKLKIIKCDSSMKCWYSKKIGKEFYFFDKIFRDSNDIESLWLSKLPTNKYVYLDETNYYNYKRKNKLLEIEKGINK